MRIVEIVGARPQFVKLAPLSHKLRERHEEIIIHTGQHYDLLMNEVFFRDMAIPAPDYNLNVGSGSQAAQTAEMLMSMEPILLKLKPDWVIVYGDTNSTLAGVLTASKLGIRTAHVEACLRSFNRTMPEEINRIVADHLSDLLFCPTSKALEQAAREDMTSKAHLVGDIMVDSLKLGLELLSDSPDILKDLQLGNDGFHLLTLHRPYNVDDARRLELILAKINALGKKIVFPVHPRTRNILSSFAFDKFSNIEYIEPQAYLDFIALMQAADMILTDSGGIQKEAYILQKPCVTLRTETEWVETVENGWNHLMPLETPDFQEKVRAIRRPDTHPDLYGSEVAQKIVSILEGAL
jgi:UDP-GlcNAc3NAcA epimerase